MLLGSLKANADYNDEQSYTRYVNKQGDFTRRSIH